VRCAGLAGDDDRAQQLNRSRYAGCRDNPLCPYAVGTVTDRNNDRPRRADAIRCVETPWTRVSRVAVVQLASQLRSGTATVIGPS
jgi:hypothetical protein